MYSPNVRTVFLRSPTSRIFDAINEAIPIGEYLNLNFKRNTKVLIFFNI